MHRSSLTLFVVRNRPIWGQSTELLVYPHSPGSNGWQPMAGYHRRTTWTVCANVPKWISCTQPASESTSKERKGKEEYLYSVFLHQGTHKALRHVSHSFTCKQHHACFSFVAFTRCHHRSNWGSRYPIAAHYSFIDPERMTGWVVLVGWPIADGLPTHKWSPISYKSSAGQRKHIGQRPMLYRYQVLQPWHLVE